MPTARHWWRRNEGDEGAESPCIRVVGLAEKALRS